MKSKLFVVVLGEQNSGKSHTWNRLLKPDGSTVKTGTYVRTISIGGVAIPDAFLISGSPEERGKYVGEILGDAAPNLVLCSAQYGTGFFQTIEFAFENGFDVHIQWLNPGIGDGDWPFFDEAGVISRLMAKGCSVEMLASKDLEKRLYRLSRVIVGWNALRNRIEINVLP